MKNETLHYITCNLCGSDKTIPVTTQKGYTIVCCQVCGLVYVNPRPQKSALTEQYESYHREKADSSLAWFKLMERNFMQTARVLNRLFPHKGRILDIGCGYGHFIEIMKKRGWEVSGLDPSPHIVDFTGQKGLNIVEGTIESAQFPKYSFDVVTLFYVLEHLPDPLESLKKVYHILKKGGMLILRIPHTTPLLKFLSFFNIDNALYDPPYHLYDFSPLIIKEMLKKTGFSSVKIFPGEPTAPQQLVQKVISLSSGYLGKVIYYISNGTFLLPGISKTIYSFKEIPSDSVL